MFMPHIMSRRARETKTGLFWRRVCSIGTQIITDNNCVMLRGGTEMPPHNSLHTVSVTLYGPGSHSKQKSVFEKTVWRGLFPALLSGRDALVTGRPAGASRPGLLDGAPLLYFVKEGLQRCCVWPMCASEDKTCGSAQWKEGRTRLSLMKERCQEGYQEGVLPHRPGGRDRAEEWQTASGKPDQPSGEKHNRGTRKTAGVQITSAGAVTESIIYFRTLDLSLRFLGR